MLLQVIIGMNLLYFIAFAVMLIFTSALFYNFGIERGRKLEKLFVEYIRTLEIGDKAIASQAGRSYFSALRRGSIKPDDEESIKKDIERI